MLHRYGSVAEALALRLLALSPGDRFPSVGTLAEAFGTGRGTVQAALKMLLEEGAVNLESRGSLGSFLVSLDEGKLLARASLSPLIGAMPVAYSPRFQGLATGLTRSFAEVRLPLVLAQLRGGKNRIHFLRTGRCDLAIISRMAWEAEEPAGDLRLVHSFGPGSNVSDHVFLFREAGLRGIMDHMRVGVDPSSHDHVRLTQEACAGRQVSLVPISYAEAVTRLVSGDIDAALWDTGVPLPPGLPLTTAPRERRDPLGDADTEAVMVVLRSSGPLAQLLRQRINPQQVVSVQEQVVAGTELPMF